MNDKIKRSAIFLISTALLSQAYAQEKKSEADEKKILYGADSTRVTPRMGNLIPANTTGQATSFEGQGSSLPLRTAHNCSSYRGQYDIDSKAIGTLYITTENNPFLPNYRKIIGSDNSGCYQPCSPTNSRSTKSCSSEYGTGWTGKIIYNTYSSCTTGGYLQAHSPTYVSDSCSAPPPPPAPEPVPTLPPVVVPTPTSPPVYIPTPTPPPVYIPTPTPPPVYIPTPTPPPVVVPTPTPPPTGCMTVYGYYVASGTVLTQCDIWGYGNAYPRGQNFRCTASGWATNNPGSSTVEVYCE